MNPANIPFVQRSYERYQLQQQQQLQQQHQQQHQQHQQQEQQQQQQQQQLPQAQLQPRPHVEHKGILHRHPCPPQQVHPQHQRQGSWMGSPYATLPPEHALTARVAIGNVTGGPGPSMGASVSLGAQARAQLYNPRGSGVSAVQPLPGMMGSTADTLPPLASDAVAPRAVKAEPSSLKEVKKKKPARAAAASPYAGSSLKVRRKLAKNTREKQRRSELNDKFDKLCKLLHLGRKSKAEKFSILSEAISLINQLRQENTELRQEKMELAAELSKLTIALQNAYPVQPDMEALSPSSDGTDASYPVSSVSSVASLRAHPRLPHRQPPHPQQSPHLPARLAALQHFQSLSLASPVITAVAGQVPPSPGPPSPPVALGSGAGTGSGRPRQMGDSGGMGQGMQFSLAGNAYPPHPHQQTQMPAHAHGILTESGLNGGADRGQHASSYAQKANAGHPYSSVKLEPVFAQPMERVAARGSGSGSGSGPMLGLGALPLDGLDSLDLPSIPQLPGSSLSLGSLGLAPLRSLASNASMGMGPMGLGSGIAPGLDLGGSVGDFPPYLGEIDDADLHPVA